MSFVQERGICHILGREWYFSLKSTKDQPYGSGGKPRGPGLFDIIDEDSLAQKKCGVDGGLLVCYNPLGKYHIYSFFHSIEEFHEYEDGIHPKDRCFFEVIIGPQKMKFDVDIDIKTTDGDSLSGVGPQLRDEVIIRTLEVYRDMKIDINPSNIIVHDSHIMYGEDGKASYSLSKRSYHIVVDGYYHSNHTQTKEVFKRILSKVTHKHKSLIDASVYKSIQQFRIQGSRKYDSGRPKIPSGFSIDGKIFHSSNILSRSLASYVSGCKLVEDFIIEKPVVAISSHELSDKDIESAMNMLREHEGGDHFSINTVSGPTIILKRLEPSYCRICNRIHEHDNPYITIVQDNVFLYCRRALGTGGKIRFFLGLLEGSISKDLPSSSISGGDRYEGPIVMIGDKEFRMGSSGWIEKERVGEEEVLEKKEERRVREKKEKVGEKKEINFIEPVSTSPITVTTTTTSPITVTTTTTSPITVTTTTTSPIIVTTTTTSPIIVTTTTSTTTRTTFQRQAPVITSSIFQISTSKNPISTSTAVSIPSAIDEARQGYSTSKNKEKSSFSSNRSYYQSSQTFFNLNKSLPYRKSLPPSKKTETLHKKLPTPTITVDDYLRAMSLDHRVERSRLIKLIGKCSRETIRMKDVPTVEGEDSSIVGRALDNISLRMQR